MNRSDSVFIVIFVALIVAFFVFELIGRGGGVLALFVAIAFGWCYANWKLRWWKKDEGA